MSNRTAFVNAILRGDLDAAGPFADWLDEHGEGSRGVLLRRRWKRWRKEREAAVAQMRREREEIVKPFRELIDRFRASGGTVREYQYQVEVSDYPVQRADASFKAYVRKWFREPVGKRQ